MRQNFEKLTQSEQVRRLSIFTIILLDIAVVFSIVFCVTLGIISKSTNDQLALIDAADQFMDGSAYLTNEVRAYAATGDKTHYDNYWKEINEWKNRDIGYNTMIEIGITDEEVAMIDEMSALSNNLVPLEESAMTNTQEGDKQAAIDYVYGSDYMANIAKIQELQERFITTMRDRTSNKVNTLTLVNIILAIISIIFMLLSVAMSVITKRVVRINIMKPVMKVRDHCLRLAEGDFTTKIDLPEDHTEIGMLVNGINTTQKNVKTYLAELTRLLKTIEQGDLTATTDVEFLGDFVDIENSIEEYVSGMTETLNKVIAVSKNVDNGSDQVASASHSVAEGASDQSAGVEELSSSINEMAEKIAGTAEDLREINRMMEDSKVNVQSGTVKMEEMKGAMRDIADKSEEIKLIMNKINEITAQTNLLSLNASIEAARAGEAGKGFAVVANEVSALAAQSSASSKEIAALIEETIQAVAVGTQKVDETAEVLTIIVESNEKISEEIEHVTGVADTEAAGMQQLTSGIDSIANVVQMNSAASQELAASGQGLSEYAQSLKEMMGQFKLNDTENLTFEEL